MILVLQAGHDKKEKMKLVLQDPPLADSLIINIPGTKVDEPSSSRSAKKLSYLTTTEAERDG